MSDARKTGTPSTATLTAILATEIASIEKGASRRFDELFAEARRRHAANGAGRELEFYDLAIAELKRAIIDGKKRCDATVFDQPYVEGERNVNVPFAAKAASLLEADGFIAKAEPQNKEIRSLAINTYQIVIAISTRD